jgi:peroxiredoxin
MGQARRQRQAAEAAIARRRERVLWAAAAGLAAIALVAAGVLALRSQSGAPAPGPAANQAAADRGAPAALVKAADAIGFHTSTEPGVGLMESQPASAARPPSTSDLLAVGSTAPAFTLKTPQGENVSLSQYRGKVVLLELFATWCPHCQAEAPHLAAIARQLTSKGVRVLSINGDSENAASVFAFHRYFGLPYPALLDPGGTPGSFTQPGGAGTMSRAYRLHAFPTFYVINAKGTITFASDGEQPDALLRQQLLAARA